MSKIESGMVDFNKEKLDLIPLFEEVCTSLKPRLKNNAVELVSECPRDSLYVESDRYRLAQVLINFGTNAIKHTSVGTITIGYEVIGKSLKVYVEDIGKGISEVNFGKLFKRFEKLDTFEQGSGLGLVISKSIVEAAGGEIGFSSKEDVGYKFWAIFPDVIIEDIIKFEN